MLRVPGSQQDLLSLKALGADIRIVYSPLDALKLAQEKPGNEVVFFGVGFETTAPTVALAIYQAKQLKLKNFFCTCLSCSSTPCYGCIAKLKREYCARFFSAGHVCTIMGYHEYLPITERYNIPIVITGFERLIFTRNIFVY